MKVLNKITMRLLCLILFSAIGFTTFGRTAGDTIVVYVDNRIEMMLIVKDYDELRSSNAEIEALDAFLSVLPDIAGQLTTGADMIDFIPGEEVSIKPGDPSYKFLIKDQEVSNTGYRDVLRIELEESAIQVTTSDLSLLKDHPLSECVRKVKAILPEKNRHSKTFYYDCREGSVAELSDKSRTNLPLDMLNFSAGAGAGLVKNFWIPDLSFEIGIQLNKKGVLRHNAYISSNLLFDFSTESNLNINTFLNAGFRWNLDKDEETPDWLGFEVGYLIGQEGNLFGENTMKAGLNWSLFKGRSVTVSPHLYLTDNFKTVYPGIRIGIGI